MHECVYVCVCVCMCVCMCARAHACMHALHVAGMFSSQETPTKALTTG